ncbi:MAG: acyltransferase [Croceitalea sp.]|nr:acyltransferase [Croceitalea sp.]NNC34182.1 acyltransferase [Croceitalea sp.]NNL08564.1 acyltransferase [Croceitalea sp.]NNM17755.1 acyltransferase [Croceitalea sp.]
MILISHYDNRYLPAYFSESFFYEEAWIYVEFFLVLSGFVIGLNYNEINTIKSFSIYLKKRFARLYPLLFFTVALFFMIDILSNIFFEKYINTPESIPSIMLRTIDSLLFMNSTPLISNSLGMNEPSWSISVEMICYVLFGIITLFCKRRLKIALYIVIIVLAAIFRYYKLNGYFIGYNLMFLRGLISFGLGYILYEVSKWNIVLNKSFEYIVPVLVILPMYLVHNAKGFITEVVILNASFFLTILILLKTDGFLTWLLNTKTLQYLGKLSYSIYLNHLLLLLIISRAAALFFDINEPNIVHIPILVVAGLFIVLFSNYTYKYVEVKAGNQLKKLLLKA